MGTVGLMIIQNTNNTALEIEFPRIHVRINPGAIMDLTEHIKHVDKPEQYINHPKLIILDSIVLDSYPGFEEYDPIESRFEILDL